MAIYSPTPVPTPDPSISTGTGDADQVWNEGFNYGYTNADLGVTYPDQNYNSGFIAGQQAYFTDLAKTTNTTNTNTTTTNVVQPPTNTSSYNFNMGDFPNYTGWDSTAAQQDWMAKGSPMPGVTSSSGSQVDPYAQVRNDINSGYNNYFQQLDSMLNNDLPTQYGNQNQIVNNSYNQGITDLDSQNRIGMSDLQGQRTEVTQNQNKNLKDMAENIRNLFMTGNVMLGSRGAGDSSASKQYSYALTKLGNKARGDITSQAAGSMDQIRQREFKLSETYNTEKSRLATEKQNKILEISSWLSEQQNQIRQAKASGELSKSTDLANLSKNLLDQALSALNQANSEITNRNSMLDQWAINNSKNIAQLKSNFEGISNYKAPTINSPQFSGTPSFSGGNFNLPINWTGGYSKDEDEYKSYLG